VARHISSPSGGDCIVLIGMPGVGKSTLGVLLAKATARAFIDTDLVIQTHEGQPLQALLNEHGPLGFRRIEERALLQLDCRATVVATGGSAVYSAAAMAHLAQLGRIVFLHLPIAELEQRLSNFSDRGVVRFPGQSLADVFQEREALYRKYADIHVECAGLYHEQAVSRILKAISK
jgi:shikimate kinase